MTDPAAILLVEDNEDDVFLMERALKSAGILNPLYVAEDGQEAIHYLSGTGKYQDRNAHPMPRIIFLDLKLPIMLGHEVLAWIRKQPQFESIVVVVLTSSNQPNDLKTSYRFGANSYLVKPPSASQLLDLVKAFRWDWMELKRSPTSERVAEAGLKAAIRLKPA